MADLLSDAEIADFQKLLQGYSPHQDALDNFKKTKLGVIMGPAGSGKDTLREELLKTHPDNYRAILSDTSRPKRPHETEGVEYNFKSVSEMRQGFEDKTYLQGQIVHGQQVSGMHASQFQDNSGKIALSILVVQTEKILFELNQQIRSIFLVPPTYQALQERISAKRSMTVEEKNRRLESAVTELRTALATQRYYCVMTASVPQTVATAHKFFKTGERDADADAACRQVLRKILTILEAQI